jgi:hypothetical protein
MCDGHTDPYCPIDEAPAAPTLDDRLLQLQEDDNVDLEQALELLWEQAGTS